MHIFGLPSGSLSISNSRSSRARQRKIKIDLAFVPNLLTANAIWRVICILFENRLEKQFFGASVSLLQPSIHEFLEASQDSFGGASFADSWSFRVCSTCLTQPPNINLTSDRCGASSERTRNLTNCKTNCLTRMSSLF